MITNQTERLNFASTKNIPNYPDFLDVQVKSFQDFFQLETKSDERGNEGLYNTFMENFPITDTRNNFVLEFLDYFVDPPRYTIQECIDTSTPYPPEAMVNFTHKALRNYVPISRKANNGLPKNRDQKLTF